MTDPQAMTIQRGLGPTHGLITGSRLATGSVSCWMVLPAAMLVGLVSLAVLQRLRRRQVRLKDTAQLPASFASRKHVNGDAVNGHNAKVHAVNGHSVSGHAVNGHIASVKEASSGVSLAILAATIYVSNIGANLLNKQMLKDFAGCPLSGCALIFGIGGLLSLASWQLGLKPTPKAPTSRCMCALLPVAALQCLTALLTQLGVARLKLSLFHTIKATEPLWTVLLSFLVLGVVPPRRVMASLMLIICGVALSTAADVSLNWIGLVFALGSNVAFVGKNVLAKKLLKAEGMDGLDLIAFITMGSFAISLPAAIIFEGAALPAAVAVAPGSLAMHLARFMGAGALFHLYQVSSMLLLSWFSPITHSVVNSLKRPTLVIMSIVFFHTPISFHNGLGILCALLGAHFYGKVTLINGKHTNGKDINAKHNPQDGANA